MQQIIPNKKMMHSKRRKLPLEVLAWVNKGNKITNSSVGTGVLPNDSRANILLNRAFHDNMINISSKRYRQLTRCNYQKETFLKSQRLKADTTMPGLLPYIEGLTRDMNRNTSASRYDPLRSSSFQSFTSSFSLKQPSLERINRLAQPQVTDPTTVSQTFGGIESVSDYNFPVLKKPPSPTNDRRFRRLVHIFAEVHQPTVSDSQTVKNLVRSKSSLQDNEEQRRRTTSHSNETENNPKQPFSGTNGQLVVACS